MPKRQTDDEIEYPQLRKFFEFYVARYFPLQGLPPESHPIVCLDALEKISASRARTGLRQAINDVMEMSLRLTPEEVGKVDAELRSLGIVSLSEVRRQSSIHFARIVKRGKITSETEFYLIRNMLDDRAEATANKRTLLAKMLSEYEKA